MTATGPTALPGGLLTYPCLRANRTCPPGISLEDIAGYLAFPERELGSA
jgi:hypothetical protein